MFCGFFARFLKIIAPGVEFSTTFLPMGRGFAPSLCPGCGMSPFKKFPGGLHGEGGGQDWN